MNRIVVIEDDPAILRGLADQLRLESYEVLTATDGEQGYGLVRKQQPDLVILDLNLPLLSGQDVCRQLRRAGMATPVLILSAQSLETERIEGFDAGADDYVTKPFSTDGITESLNAQGEEFGEERLIHLARRLENQSAVEMAQASVLAAGEFSNGKLEDDSTVVIVKVA